VAYQRKDHFFLKAKKKNYAARSIFKLEEIDQRYKLIKPGNKVLDLGAAPGSWSQYASQKVGKNGSVIGIDLQDIKLTLPNAVFIKGDILKLPLIEELEKYSIQPPFDLVISDMAPKTTGIKITDQTRSLELCEMALEIAKKHLKKGGHFICKLFHGADFQHFNKQLKQSFTKVEVLRPKSTRKASKEVFMIGIQYTKGE